MDSSRSLTDQGARLPALYAMFAALALTSGVTHAQFSSTFTCAYEGYTNPGGGFKRSGRFYKATDAQRGGATTKAQDACLAGELAYTPPQFIRNACVYSGCTEQVTGKAQPSTPFNSNPSGKSPPFAGGTQPNFPPARPSQSPFLTNKGKSDADRLDDFRYCSNFSQTIAAHHKQGREKKCRGYEYLHVRENVVELQGWCKSQSRKEVEQKIADSAQKAASCKP